MVAVAGAAIAVANVRFASKRARKSSITLVFSRLVSLSVASGGVRREVYGLVSVFVAQTVFYYLQTLEIMYYFVLVGLINLATQVITTVTVTVKSSQLTPLHVLPSGATAAVAQ